MMKPRFPKTVPALLASTSLLAGCGARSTVTDLDVEPGVCTDCAWSARYGDADRVTVATSLTVLSNDGVVVSYRRWNAPIDEPGRLRAHDARGGVRWTLETNVGTINALGRDSADRVTVVGQTRPGPQTLLGEKVTCPGEWECGFVGQISADGELNWLRVFDAGADVFPAAGAVHADGRIALAGAFGGDLDFGCGVMHSPGYSAPVAASFVTVLAPSGECVFSRRITVDGGEMTPEGTQVAFDATGGVAALVHLGGLPTGIVDLGDSTIEVTPSAGIRLGLVRYSETGDLQSSNVTSGGDNLQPPLRQLSVTGAGDALVTTVFRGTYDWGSGPALEVTTPSLLVSRIMPSGEHLWTKVIAEFDPQQPPTAVTDPLPDGGFRLAASAGPWSSFLDAADLKAGIVLFDYDADGLLRGTRPISFGPGQAVGSLASTSDGAPVLAGGFAWDIDVGSGALTAEGTSDGWVARLSR